MAMEYTDVSTGPGGARSVETVTVNRRVAWGALFAGTVAALAVQLLLMVLGMAIGLSVADSALTDRDAPGGLGVGAGIWWLATMIIALFVGGYVAARLAGLFKAADGVLHGFLTWSLTALIGTFVVTSSIGSLVGGATNLAGDTAAAFSGSITQGAGGLRGQLVRGGNRQVQEFWRNVESDADRIVSQSASSDSNVEPDEAYNEIVDAAHKAFRPGRRELDPSARNDLIETLGQYGNLGQNEASRTVNRWEQAWPGGSGEARRVTDYRMDPQEKQQALQMADTAAGYAAGASWFTFSSLLLGAIAGTLGGWLGTRTPRYGTAPRT